MWRPAVGLFWAIAVAFLTLQPGGMRLEEIGAISSFCLSCGSRGTADAVLNVVLFIPLGIVLSGGRRGIGFALLVGGLTSLGIEVSQLFMPGRHTSAADLLWNTAGTGAGTVLYLAAHRHVRGRSVGGVVPWAMAAGSTLLVAGIFSVPAPTHVDYWGQWMPDLGYMPEYDGVVLTAELNAEPMLSGRLQHDRPHRDQLTGDWHLTGRIVAASAPSGVSPILSVYDGIQREILLLGAHGADLVFRERGIGAGLGFDAPDVRVPNALRSVSPGDTVQLSVERVDERTCLALDDDEWCGVGITPGRTWGYLLYLEGPPEWLRSVVDLFWMLGIFLPIGFFARGSREAGLGLALALCAMVAAVAVTPLISGTLWEVVAAGAGVALGRALFVALVRIVGMSKATPDGSASARVPIGP